MPTDFHMFKILSQTGKNLEKKVHYKDFGRGEAIYGLYGVIDPEEAGKNLSLNFWWQSFALGKVGGWKYYYSRISSPVSLKMLQRLGA